MPSPETMAAASAASPSRRARTTAAWTSRSAGMEIPWRRAGEDPLGAAGLFEQDRKRGNVGVPFDQSRHGSETRHRAAIQVPDLRADWRAVVVDQDDLAVGLVLGVSGEMDLCNPSRRQRVEVGHGIEAEVLGGDVDVVDVAEEPAAGQARQLGEE